MLGYSHQVSEIIRLIYTYSYFILFPLVVIEGPIVTIISGFLVSTSFLDLLPTFLTIIAGDLAGDFLYYSAGRWWLNKTAKKVLNFFKVDSKRVTHLEENIKKNKGKVLFFGKLSHAIGGFILFAAGSAQISIKEFLWYNFLATIPKSLILIGVGYYLGSTVANFGKYLNYTFLGLFVFTLLLIAAYYAITKIAGKVIGKDD